MEQFKIQRTKVKIVREVILDEEIEVGLYEYVGFRISILRKQSKLSQKELAKKIKMSVPSVTNFERGRHAISIKHLAKICEVLNCKSSDILPF